VGPPSPGTRTPPGGGWGRQRTPIHRQSVPNVCFALGQEAPFSDGATAPARHLWCPHPHPQARQHRPGERGFQQHQRRGRLSTPPAPPAAARARQAAVPPAPEPCAAQPRWLPGPERGGLQMTVRSLAPRRRHRLLRPLCHLYRHLPQGLRLLRRRGTQPALRRSKKGTQSTSQTQVKRRDADKHRAAPTARTPAPPAMFHSCGCDTPATWGTAFPRLQLRTGCARGLLSRRCGAAEQPGCLALD
jgi:hypothetical protein